MIVSGTSRSRCAKFQIARILLRASISVTFRAASLGSVRTAISMLFSFQLCYIMNLNTADRRADQVRVAVKGRLEQEAPGSELHIVDQSGTQMSGTDQDHIVLMIEPQNLTDLLPQIGYVISITLLAETAEIIEVLTDLGGGHIHDPAQLLGGNPLYALFLQISEISVIPGQPADHRLRNTFISHLSPNVSKS